MVKLSGHGGRSGHRTAFAFLVLPPSGTSSPKGTSCALPDLPPSGTSSPKGTSCALPVLPPSGTPSLKEQPALICISCLSSHRRNKPSLRYLTVLPSSCTLHDIIAPTTCSSMPDLYVLHPNIPRSYNATRTNNNTPSIYSNERSFFTSARLHYTVRLSHLAAFEYPFAERVGTSHYSPS